MKCPSCEHLENKVVDSRLSSNGQVVRRRRECDKCKHRYTTYERLEYIVPAVIKKDGKRETFEREKLLRGVQVACNKRPVTAEAMEGLVDAVQRELTETGEREIPSSLIGEKVMARLRALDDVAYVRFSSVYRSFRDVEEFLSELGKLVKV